ncbi:MAG: SUMF1/EgtB/PvdO family nonheme iron enzyme [Verrucomicrobia bacterium]|nr:SUMF1/EgtB/PvdO family nonheme iron enzyme [Verrucomicrobiota bacterium]
MNSRKLHPPSMLRISAVLFLCAAPVLCAAAANPDAEARLRGAGKADPIRITNVTCESGDSGSAATVAFDLAWDGSWRAVWEEPAERTGGKQAAKLENWDAAWIFVKFRKGGADGWSHATLSPNADVHSAPTGAALQVGATEDNRRGLGVFIHRQAAGSGPVAWKGVKLRWLLDADGITNAGEFKIASPGTPPAEKPATKSKPVPDEFDALSQEDDDGLLTQLDLVDAEMDRKAARETGVVDVRIQAIRMVYVPECAFWAGDGTTNMIAGQFSAGESTEPLRVESEAALTLGGADRANLGNRDNLFAADDFSTRRTRILPAAFPKGFAAFYCMRHEITRGEMTTFLNTLSGSQQAAMEDLIGAGQNGITLTGSGLLAKYETDAPYAACDGVAWREALAFAVWAGLRPMTELEFEKACRGPLKPVPDEYAWGTAEGVGADGDKARDELRNAGASYWGILDLTGNVSENTVAVGLPIGRQFDGAHGDGTVGDLSKWNDFGGHFDDEERPGLLGGPRGWWMLGGGMIWRGAPNYTTVMRVSDRGSRTYIALASARPSLCGFRAVRSVSAGRSPATAAGEAAAPADSPRGLFNEALRIDNVAVLPGDGKSATITFDVAWDESWRNATNYDAAWIFFKARTAGGTTWAHVKLAADRVMNPAGYGREAGTKLEFVVPDGPDGFTGVFIQRAAPGTGPVSAQGVTVLCELPARYSTSDTLDLRACGIEMVYVPEGPFYLGSGGAEPNHFYKYTDGSQNTLPYQVTDAGPIPTGPRVGRLWATGVAPDGTDAGQIPAAFPNGFRAFYCMKYQLKQGQFAGFLSMQSQIRSFFHAFRPGNYPPLAKVGTAFQAGVRWAQGSAFGDWAGLRPMTELEFEKACRGPLEPVPDEIGPGYWGIRDLTSGGLVQRMVSAGSPAGRQFAGTHGGGSTALPADWPQGSHPAIAQRGGGWVIKSIGGMKFSARHRFGGDGGSDGWRGVRTAPNLKPDPATATKEPGDDFTLELDPLPELGDSDIAVFHLSGNLHHAGDQAVQVELASSLPDVCFPDGAASRAFTAAPKSATPFKILAVVTRKTVSVARRGQMLPLKVRNTGGDVLAEATVRLPLADPMAIKPAVVGCLDGGKMALRMINAADKPVAFAIEAQPPQGIVLADPARKVELAVGTEAVEITFSVSRRDASVLDGFYSIPYKTTLSGGPAQAGEAVIELRAQSRWWVSRREIRTGPVVEIGGDAPMDEMDDLLREAGLEEPKESPEETAWKMDPEQVFKSGRLPEGWQAVTHGASLWPERLKPPPKGRTVISAATRVVAPADHETFLMLGYETDGWTWLENMVLATIDGGSSPGFYPPPVRIWINGERVRDSRPGTKPPAVKSIRLKKGVNPLLFQFETGPDGKGQYPKVFALFFDAKAGAPVTDLSFDVEVKP